MNRRDFLLGDFYQGREIFREIYPKRPTMLEMLEESGGWNCWNPDLHHSVVEYGETSPREQEPTTMANTYRDMEEAKKVLKNEPVDMGGPKTIKGEPMPKGGFPKDSPGSEDHPKPGVGRDDTVYKQTEPEQVTGGHGDDHIDEDRSKKR